jgi:Baseplate J-like protein
MSTSFTACCGGCAGVAPATPVVVDNPPGQPAIVARVGTYGSFLSSMVAGLSDTDRPALAAFTTRSPDDFTISLLDAFACVADVLTFYQERYAQENYLRTATEQRSVLELARLIGYELAPGVAAHTPLAFTMDTTAGSPTSLDLPVGTQAQSIPGPGQTAQTFETVEDIAARPEWSAMQPRQTRLVVPHTGSADIWLVGGSLNVKPGDTVAVIGVDKQANPTTSEQWDFRRIIKVNADVKAGGKDPVTGAPTGVTHLVLDRALGPDSPYTEDAPPLVVLFRRQGSLFGYNAPLWGALPSQQTQTTAPVGIYAGDQYSWAEQYLPSTADSIDLDTVYSQAVPGGWVVLTEAGSSASSHTAELFHIDGAAETNLAEFALTGRATRLFISGMNIDWFSPRRASVFLQSEAQTLAERPINGPLERTRLTLASYVDGLQSGRTLIVAGQLARLAAAIAGLVLTATDGSTRTPKLGDQFFLLGHAAGVYTLQAIDGWTGTIATAAASFTQVPALTADPVLAETVTIGSVDQSDLLHTALVPVAPLVNFYDRSTVTIYGNVAQATVGQTVQEVMGSGNAATPFQSFQLRQPPVTWTLAATPTGVQSSLQVFANDVPWTEADTLYGQGAQAQVFAERRDELGNTNALFGDGALYGARPPSGTMNLRAQYRRGLGVAGNVDAGQISLLLSRPLGLKAVINPLPAIDGADPEPLEGARASAPRSVATLDRAVSLLDYQSYAQSFAGIAKALATWSWDGTRRRLVLTLAGQAGAAVPPVGDVAGKLAASLASFGEVAVPLLLQSYSPVTFQIGLLVRPAVSGNDAAAQQAAVAALRAAYSFDARGFGQAVALSEVVEIAQGGAGVAAVQVTMLYRSDQPPGLSPRLGAAGGNTGAQSAVPAEVLTLDLGPLAVLGAMA